MRRWRVHYTKYICLIGYVLSFLNDVFLFRRWRFHCQHPVIVYDSLGLAFTYNKYRTFCEPKSKFLWLQFLVKTK